MSENLLSVLDESAAQYAERTALIFGQKKISYSELNSQSRCLASSLKVQGIKAGMRVALWLPNCPEYVIAFLGIVRLGATVVPINSMFKREEARYILEDSKACILICSIEKSDEAKSILSRVATLEAIISSPAGEGQIEIFDFKKCIAEHSECRDAPAINADSLAQIVYTSGTTGKPKGVCLTHGNMVSNIAACKKAIYFSKRDCVICILPLFHSFAATVCMLLPLSCGARIVIMRSITPFKRVIRALFKHRVSIFIGVPSLFAILTEIKLKKWQWLLNRVINPIRLSISGAAALPPAVWERFEKKFKRPLLQGYGLTEASPVVSLNPLKGLRKPDSIGLPIEKVRVKVVDKQGVECVCGQVGELLVKGPNVMQGYYNLDQETEDAIVSGWLHTGDLASIDEDGYIFIKGRSKDMINVRGFNVYPREIEDLLYQYPHIKEVAVVGVNHRHRGEVPIAFVVAETELAQSDIIGYLRSNLAAYKVPLKVIFKDSLPKNTTGKILKRSLRTEITDIFL